MRSCNYTFTTRQFRDPSVMELKDFKRIFSPGESKTVELLIAGQTVIFRSEYEPYR